MTMVRLRFLAFAVNSLLLSATTQAEEMASIADALAAGKTNLHLRARYESVEEDGLEDAAATTLKTRLTYTSAPYSGFQLGLKMDDTTEIGKEDYTNGVEGKGTAAIADPEVTEVNQAYISYTNWSSVFKYGRQRIILNNQRFVGGVGWRQDEQTFDGFSVSSKPMEKAEIFASYITQANRIFAEAGDHNHETVLLNGKYSTAVGAITGYAYLIDNQTVAAFSSDTYGVRWEGKLGDHVGYNLEYATQSDAADAPIEYSSDYLLAEINGKMPIANKAINIKAGYEVLGSDEGIKAFATPLATLHAFQGWTDRFLATPVNGIQDTYASVGSEIGGISLNLVYHLLQADYGSEDFGTEIGFVASTKVGPVGVTLKYADYDADADELGTPAYTKDTSKLWLMAAITF